MEVIDNARRAALIANGAASAGDPMLLVPVVKLYTPDAGLTWLLASMDPMNHDRVWGLRDDADGAPRLTCDSLERIVAIRGRLGRAVIRDDVFLGNAGIGAYAAAAEKAGIVLT